MSQVFKCNNISFKVFVEDTDFQGVVYHANYLKYFERARSQFLNDYEISQVTALLKDESYIIKKIDLSFFHSAKLEDELIIKSEVELSSKARMIFNQSAHIEKSDTLICKGKVEVCYLNGITGKPKIFPAELLALFE